MTSFIISYHSCVVEPSDSMSAYIHHRLPSLQNETRETALSLSSPASDKEKLAWNKSTQSMYCIYMYTFSAARSVQRRKEAE